jgi:hypothetical protein
VKQNIGDITNEKAEAALADETINDKTDDQYYFDDSDGGIDDGDGGLDDADTGDGGLDDEEEDVDDKYEGQTL